MEQRFAGDSEIGFFNRLYFYPTFAIVILDTVGIPEEEKQKFKDTILARYFTDSEYRKSLEGQYVIFYENKLRGVYSRLNLPKGSGNFRRFLIGDYPEEITYINTDKFPWRKYF